LHNNSKNKNKIIRGGKHMTKRTTISLSDAELKQLRELAEEERRPVSRQIIYMMEFYKKQR
jgi:hypothetical protein